MLACMKRALLITTATATLLAAETAAPTPESVIINYAKSLTRLTEKPKSISAELAAMCRSIPDDQTHGPHSRSYVHHFRNQPAMSMDGDFAPGSVLVKEKFRAKEPFNPSPDNVEPAGLAGMIKLAPGASPRTGDWQFFEAYDGKVVTKGAQACAGCHSGAPRDHVFTKSTPPAEKQHAEKAAE